MTKIVVNEIPKESKECPFSELMGDLSHYCILRFNGSCYFEYIEKTECPFLIDIKDISKK